MKRIQTKFAAPWIMVFIVLVSLIYLYHNSDLRYAMISSSDQADVKYMEYTIKNTCEFGWFFENPRTDGGAGELYEHSMGDFIQYVIVCILGIFTTNFDLIYNIFYLLTYFLCAMAMYLTSRLLKMTPGVSAMTGLLFTFLPWHQMRMHHLMSSAFYATVPLALLVSVWIAEGETKGVKQWKLGRIALNQKFVLICVLTLVSSLSDVIWSAFNCYILFIAIVIALFRDRDVGKLKSNLIILVLEIVGTLMMYVPAFFHYWRFGANASATAFTRHPSQAEVFGLKLICLFLPRSDHRFELLADINEIYRNYVGANENVYVSLGVIGCIGFVLLLLLLFSDKSEKRGRTLALLNIGLFMVATVGGVGAIVAYFVPQIRTYNRMSIYIAGLSILYLGFLFDKIWLTARYNRKKWVLLAGGLLLLLDIYDCTVVYEKQDQKEIISETDSTRDFVKTIESSMENGSKIYQVPYTSLPEAGYYDMLDGYLYSDNLIWSFGSRKGTDTDIWQKELMKLDSEEFCEQIAIEGYRGLYIDLTCLNTSDVYGGNTFLEEISGIVGTEPIYSADGTLCYYDLNQWSDEYLAKKSQGEIDKLKIPTVEYTEGFSDENVDMDERKFRWCDGKGKMIINNRSSVKRTFEISFYADSYADFDNEMSIFVNGEEKKYVISNDHNKNSQNSITFMITLPAGKNEVYLKSSLEPLENIKGFMKQTFFIKDFKITPKEK